jgi:hypothetical protein
MDVGGQDRERFEVSTAVTMMIIIFWEMIIIKIEKVENSCSNM